MVPLRSVCVLLMVLAYAKSQLISVAQEKNTTPTSVIDILTAAASSYADMQYGAGSLGYNAPQMLAGNNYAAPSSYPSYDTKPQSYGFDCYGKPPAMYGNANYDCRIFHVCQADGRQDTLKCGLKTKFNNYLGVCDWEDKIDNTCMPLYREETYSSGSNYGVGSNQNYGGSQLLGSLGQYAPQPAVYAPRPLAQNTAYNKMY